MDFCFLRLVLNWSFHNFDRPQSPPLRWHQRPQLTARPPGKISFIYNQIDLWQLCTKTLKLSPLKNCISQIVPMYIYMTGIKKTERSSDLLKLLWTHNILFVTSIHTNRLANPYRGDGFNSIVWQNGQIKSISVKTRKSFKRRGRQATEWRPRRKQLSLAITPQVRKLLTTLCKVTQL